MWGLIANPDSKQIRELPSAVAPEEPHCWVASQGGPHDHTTPGRSLRVFAIDGTGAAAPTEIASSTFQALKLREVQDLERWLKQQPDLMGEPLKIVSSQFAGFDGTWIASICWRSTSRRASSSWRSSRTRGAAARRSCKRCGTRPTSRRSIPSSSSSSTSSTSNGSTAARSARLTRGTSLRSSSRPKTASHGSTTTPSPRPARRLRIRRRHHEHRALAHDNFELDITCVQVSPMRSRASCCSPHRCCCRSRKRRTTRCGCARSDAAAPNVAALAAGSISPRRVRSSSRFRKAKWSSYGDVAAAAGAPSGAQAVGGWLLREADTVPVEVYRCSSARASSHQAGTRADDLPPTAADVIAQLRKDGVRFDDQERASQDDRWSPEDWLGAGDE